MVPCDHPRCLIPSIFDKLVEVIEERDSIACRLTSEKIYRRDGNLNETWPAGYLPRTEIMSGVRANE